MVSYCDNLIDCRRRLILAHFGEAFDPVDCALVLGCECDNCHAAESQKLAQRDLTADAKALVEAVSAFVQSRRNVTLNYLIDIFRGKIFRLYLIWIVKFTVCDNISLVVGILILSTRVSLKMWIGLALFGLVAQTFVKDYMYEWGSVW